MSCDACLKLVRVDDPDTILGPVRGSGDLFQPSGMTFQYRTSAPVLIDHDPESADRRGVRARTLALQRRALDRGASTDRRTTFLASTRNTSQPRFAAAPDLRAERLEDHRQSPRRRNLDRVSITSRPRALRRSGAVSASQGAEADGATRGRGDLHTTRRHSPPTGRPDHRGALIDPMNSPNATPTATASNTATTTRITSPSITVGSLSGLPVSLVRTMTASWRMRRGLGQHSPDGGTFRSARSCVSTGQKREPDYSGDGSPARSPPRGDTTTRVGRGGRSMAHIPLAASVQTNRRPGIGQVLGVR